jgi:hypothetical protein
LKSINQNNCYVDISSAFLKKISKLVFQLKIGCPFFSENPGELKLSQISKINSGDGKSIEKEV